MVKNINELLEETERLTKENAVLLQKLHEAKESFDAFKSGSVDALVIAGETEVKVLTEKTADKIYRILIEKMHEGAITLSEDGTILYCNSYFANLINLPLQKVTGTIFKNFISEPSKERFVSLLEQDNGEPIKEEVFICSNDGKEIPVLMSINTLLLNDISVLSIIVTDLTSQNKIQQELVIANKELVYQNEEKEKRAAELVIAYKELVYQNEEKEKRAAELVNCNKDLVFQNEEKEKQAAELIVLTGNLKAQQIKLREANIDLNEKARLLQDQEEKVRIINDDLRLLNQNLETRVFERTSELEKLNHELNNLNLSKDKFLSVISHDLRNPLSALLMSIELLNLKTENDIFKEIQPLIKIMDKTSGRIVQQLNDLLEWAQSQQQKTILNSAKLNLAHEVNKSLELLIEIATQKKIILENKVPIDIYINADNVMLGSIIQNLVTNAIKFTHQNGLITVTAYIINDMVEIYVTDSGIGIEEDTRKNLFTNYKSTSVPGTNDEKGTGLGLMLVKDFVSQNGGTIRVESKSEKGTNFIFTMPKYEDH